MIEKVTERLYTKQEIIQFSNDTKRIGTLKYVTYDDLVRYLGEPTLPDPSDDDRVQVEWIFNLDGEGYTVYDYKSPSRDYTLQERDTWCIGGTERSLEFLEYLENEIGKTILIEFK